MLREVNGDQVLAEEQPTTIEVTLKEFDELVVFKKALDALLVSPEYQAVIGKGYLKEDRDRLVGLLCSRNQAAIRDKDVIVNKIQAKGYLEQWIESSLQGLDGIDNPRQREELVSQLESAVEESEDE